MRRNVKIGLIAVSIVAVAGFVWWIRPPSFLPMQRPEDFTIQWVEGGGMDPEGSQATVTEGASRRVYDEFNSGVYTESMVDFQVSAEEMDALYAMMKREAFDTIRETNVEYYDGDNASVTISWGEQDYRVSGMQVRDLDAGRYRKVYKAIADFLAAKTSP